MEFIRQFGVMNTKQRSLLRVVKLGSVFLTLSLGDLQAASNYSQKMVFTMNVENTTVQDLFNQIETESEYIFFYLDNSVQLDRKVSVSVKDKRVDEVLDQVFEGTNSEYHISDRQILVGSKEKFNTKTVQTNDNEETHQVTGTVVDADGLPIIGANVLVKGTTTGVVTDMDGNFALDIPQNALLQISYIGYVSQTIDTKGENNFAIQMHENTQTLEDVVVVGFGTQKKVNVIGSIATVDTKQLENRATSSVINAMQGQMAGVTVSQGGGRPGIDTGTIRVRGVGSFGATPDALILIDGIPGNMSDINPNDIESISVLKDASTAAIYGARAANGVVLITTKQGREGKISVGYKGYVGLNRATDLPEFIDSWEYAELLNEVDGVTRFTPEQIQAMQDGSMPDEWANEKYVDDIFSGNGLQTGHDISLSGGSERSQYFTSFSYLTQNGVVPHNNYTRYTARVNLNSQLSKKLEMSIRIRGDHGTVDEPSTAGSVDGDGMMLLVQQGMRFPGFRPSVLSDGTWGPGVKNFGSPEAWLASESFVEKITKRINTNVNFDYTPVDGLVLSALGAYNYAHVGNRNFKASLPVTINDVTKVLGPSFLNQSSAETAYMSFQATANYTKSFNKVHNINLLLGYSWEEQQYRDMSGRRDDFPSNDFPYLGAGSPDNQTNAGGGYDWAIQSFFGRGQYNYAERYLAEVTMRYDGSSRFPSTQRYAFFPSAALGWRLSEESFVRENESLRFVDNLKLKASIGMLGNNNIGNYAYHSVYQLGAGYNYPIGGVVNQGAALRTYVDPNLKWETTRTIDAGIESIFWKGLLSFNATYFYRYTYDILFKPNASASAIFGLEMSEVNTGEASNRGWEFELGHRNQIGEFNYGINANFTVVNNRVESLGVGNVTQPNGMVGNGSSLFIGHPMQMYYGYQTDGVFQDQADIDSWFEHTDQSKLGANKKNTKPGDIRYKDISGPDGVPDGKVDATYDRVYLGSRIPKFTYGIALNAAYKGFDFNLFLQGVAKVSGMLSHYSGWALWSEGNVQRWQYEGAFDPENPVRNPEYPRIQNLGNAIGNNTQTSDFWVRNASYLRIKNVQLGYSMPSKLFKDKAISSVRFYASAENPYTFHNYPEGWDPQVNSSGPFYPLLANYTFGVNLKF